MVATEHLFIAERKFSFTDGKEAPPKSGDYVAFGGRFFSVTEKIGYPVNVLVDIAANAPGKVVVIQADDLYACLSGSGRYVKMPGNLQDMTPADKEAFYKSLLRMTLASDHKEVVLLGDIAELDDTPFDRVDAAKLPLPTVIKPRRSVLMVSIFLALVGMSFFSTRYVTSVANQEAAAIDAELASAQKELDVVFAAVKEGRAKLAEAPAQATPTASGSKPLPVPTQSFMDQYRGAARATTSVVRITDGKLQF